VENNVLLSFFNLKGKLGAGNSNIFGIFTPKIGEMIQFDYYFSIGLVQPPTSNSLPLKIGRNAPKAKDPIPTIHVQGAIC